MTRQTALSLIERTERNFRDIEGGLFRYPESIRREKTAWLHRGAMQVSMLRAAILTGGRRDGLGFVPLLWAAGALLVGGGGAWVGSQIQKWFDDSEKEKTRKACSDAALERGLSVSEAMSLCYKSDGIPAWLLVILTASLVFGVGWFLTRRGR